MEEEFFFINQVICKKGVAVKVNTVHINSIDFVTIIGCVVINALVGIATRCVNCDFVLAVGNLATSTLLVNRTENVKELTYA